MSRIEYFDNEEKELIEAYEKGEFEPVEDQERVKREVQEAARRYLKKEARINIRLSNSDLTMLKARAAEEGLAYQSLISSILHKYVAGRTINSSD
jgi:predicted DNA binding CopG/RHH family protein